MAIEAEVDICCDIDGAADGIVFVQVIAAFFERTGGRIPGFPSYCVPIFAVNAVICMPRCWGCGRLVGENQIITVIVRDKIAIRLNHTEPICINRIVYDRIAKGMALTADFKFFA